MTALVEHLSAAALEAISGAGSYDAMNHALADATSSTIFYALGYYSEAGSIPVAELKAAMDAISNARSVWSKRPA
jgi:hypothetical protein